jgi:hypothetical protein
MGANATALATVWRWLKADGICEATKLVDLAHTQATLTLCGDVADRQLGTFVGTLPLQWRVQRTMRYEEKSLVGQ